MRQPPPSELPPHHRPPKLTPRSPAELTTPTRPPQASRRLKPIREPRRLNGFFRFINGTLTFAFLVFILVGLLAVLLRTSFDRPGPLTASTSFAIPKGEGIIEIASRLERDGIVTDRRIFAAHYYAARYFGGLSGEKATIKAGDYEIKKAASIRQVLDTLVEGRSILLKLTIPEGLTSQQVVERLRAEPNLTGEIAQIPAEGTLMPDTYRFSRGQSRQELIDRMKAEQQKALAAAWERRQPDLPFKSPEQALVMASIVEKETGKADERDRVAAVFVNRLRKNMRLQSDPTIIYGIVGGQGSLGRAITRADIDGKTPYNTYQIDGLPPGPICNPGRAAIEATLNPAKTNDLYFVADGTGGHTFSTTLKEHNAAVQVWRRIEREQKTKQTASGTAIQISAPESRPAAKEEASQAGAGEAPAAAKAGNIPLPTKNPRKQP
jgi:UPF0755 protein